MLRSVPSATITPIRLMAIPLPGHRTVAPGPGIASSLRTGSVVDDRHRPLYRLLGATSITCCLSWWQFPQRFTSALPCRQPRPGIRSTAGDAYQWRRSLRDAAGRRRLDHVPDMNVTEVPALQHRPVLRAAADRVISCPVAAAGHQGVSVLGGGEGAGAAPKVMPLKFWPCSTGPCWVPPLMLLVTTAPIRARTGSACSYRNQSGVPG